jgi:hypothetical protein
MFSARMTQDGEPLKQIVGSARVEARARAGWTTRFGRAIAAIGCALSLGAAAPSAHAAAFDLNDAGWEGESELLEIARTELGATRVHAVAVLNWDELQPEDGVIAIHPLQAMDEGDTAAFMKAGGRLAILDDYGRGDETLSRFHIDRIPPPSRPVSALRNKPALAIAEPVVDVVAGHSGGPHPVVAHVQQLVTNHPMGLRHPNLSPVLRIRAIGEPDVVIAVAGQVGKGRLFAMSDPSATINQMLRYPGNRAFVAGLSRYLVDDDGATRRQGRLFIVANRFTEEGSFGGEGTVRKDIDTQIKALAAALAEARNDGLPAWAHVLAAAAAALGLALWVARASARPYRSPLPRYARPTPLVAQGGVAGRFAVLAAPTSPRSLALLELKSGLVEALTHKLGLGAEPAPDALARLAVRAGGLDAGAASALTDVLQMMHEVESAVVAGRPANVSLAALAQAASVVHSVVAACGADGNHARPVHHPVHAPAQGDPAG